MTVSPPSFADADPLLEGLTEPQREAVTHVDGPLLVLAGPGSGKTRVITRRIAHLVLRVGIPPWNVLAITFTNKAAAEMRARVSELVSARQAEAITVATFHSFCARTLRRYADVLGLKPGFSIYDSTDQQQAIKRVLKDLEIATTNFSPGSVLATISNAKNDLTTADEYARNASDFYTKTVARIFVAYQHTLEKNNALDFDDLLIKMVGLLRHHSQARDELRQRYQYLLVDEYQDTNHAQFMIAHGLSAQHTNLCVTGDPDQSIYGWRGANIKNILEFEEHYPDAKIVRLEQNYRSTKKILAAADALIQRNSQRKHKSLWTDNEDGQDTQVVRLRTEKDEAAHVVEQLRRCHDELKIPWGGMAIFYRMNSLSRVVEEQLRNNNIPYQIARGTAFYDRKEIKDALAYLKAIANPDDEVSLARIINTPARGISDRTVQALRAHALAHDLPLYETLFQPQNVPPLATRAINSVGAFGKMLRTWRQEVGYEAAGGAAEVGSWHSLRMVIERVLAESGLHDYYASDKSATPDEERLANLGELISSAQQFEQEFEALEEAEPEENLPEALRDDRPLLVRKLEGFLERVSLVSDIDGIDGEQGAVTLMTLHAAKGLEFPVVAMVGVEDGLLPHNRSQESQEQLQEERRLAFVGITRAQRVLLLTHTRSRTIFGTSMPSIPSRFLGELPDEHIEIRDLSTDDDWLDAGSRASQVIEQRQAIEETAGGFAPGQLVRHAYFGLGRVVSVNPTGVHTRAKVNFNTVGPKTLVLEYARLEPVEK